MSLGFILFCCFDEMPSTNNLRKFTVQGRIHGGVKAAAALWSMVRAWRQHTSAQLAFPIMHSKGLLPASANEQSRQCPHPCPDAQLLGDSNPIRKGQHQPSPFSLDWNPNTSFLTFSFPFSGGPLPLTSKPAMAKWGLSHGPSHPSPSLPQPDTLKESMVRLGPHGQHKVLFPSKCAQILVSVNSFCLVK